MNQKNAMAWRLAILAGAAGMAIGTASARDGDASKNEDAAENVETTIRMLHEASYVTPAPETWSEFANGRQPDFPLAACFDRANPPSPDIMAAVQQYMQGSSRYQLASRWSGAQGSPRALTWSFVPDGVSVPGGVGEPTAPNVLFSRFDTLFSSQGGRATWINRFVQVFNRWSQLSGLSYTRVQLAGVDWDDGASFPGSAGAAGVRGDIRITAHNIDGGSGVLAYTMFPANGDMVFDSSESWASSTNMNRFLRNTIAHEHGHGIGFNHVCPANGTKLMEPFLSTSYDGPRQDDTRAVQRHYGDPNEDDNSPAAATDVGIIGVPSSTVLGNPPAPVAGTSDANSTVLSIDANGEADYFKVNVAGPALVSFTVTPVGTSYVAVAQSTNCNETTPLTDALRQANLAASLYQSDGITLLHDASAAATGVAETLSGILVSDSDGGAAFMYLRVYETDTPTQSQLYRVTINGLSTPTMSASDDTFTDKVRVTWTDVNGETGYQIFRSTDLTLPGAPISSVPADVSTFDDATAVPGTQYNYWVKATFSAGAARMVAGPDAGRAQFVEPSCPADFNQDGQVDFSDYLEFLNHYDAGC